MMMMKTSRALSCALFVLSFRASLPEIMTPVWQQYSPESHAWASISELATNPYNPNSNSHNLHNYHKRVRVGQGRFHMLPSGNVEISCDFPDIFLMISNIVWERADMGTRDLGEMYRRHGISHQYDVHTRQHGSTLHLFDVTPLDRGLYRCIASVMDPASNQILTLFQDTEFWPEYKGY